MSRNGLLQKDFFDEKFLMTAGGTTAAVWMACGVLNSLTVGWLPYYYWRWIAFVFSMILSFVFGPKHGSTTIRSLIIIFLNGIVVYAGASGFNAISNGVELWGDGTAKEARRDKELSIMPFKDADWWPSITLTKKVARMEDSIRGLKIVFSNLTDDDNNLRKAFDSLLNVQHRDLPKAYSSVAGQIALKDKTIQILRQRVADLNATNSSLRRQSNSYPNNSKNELYRKLDLINNMNDLIRIMVNSVGTMENTLNDKNLTADQLRKRTLSDLEVLKQTNRRTASAIDNFSK